MNSRGPREREINIPLERTGGGAVLPDGVYQLRVEKVEVKDGPSGNPFLNFTMIILGNNGKPTSNRIWDVISLGEKSRFMMDQFLDAVEAPTEGKIPPRWFVGKKVWASLTQDTYKGTLKNVVKQYIIPDLAKQLQQEAGEEPEMDLSGGIGDSWDDDDTDEQTSVLKDVPPELADSDDIPF